jgi:hypothetical protein
MEREINIFFRPIGNLNTASSRLRVWNIQPFIEKSVVGIADEYRKGDTLVIQKVPDINELRKAKSQGAKVIYDIDDCYWKENHVFENWKDYLQMIKECDLLTVDTNEKKEMLKNIKEAVVIPDSLDWDGITRETELKNGIACWTSYGNNAGYLDGIKIPYKLKLITTPDYKNYFSGNCEFIEWDLETVDKNIRESELMVIRLPDNDFANCKGMHKLIKSWANGVPCYTSPMPDYVRAMKEAGVGEKYLVKNKEDWKNIKVVDFDERCRKYALKYEAKEIAKQWKKLF